MIVEYLKYNLDGANSEKFVSTFTVASQVIIRSPHAISFELSRNDENEHLFVVRIIWTSISDHKNGFVGSAEFDELISLIKPYNEFLEEMNYYHPIVESKPDNSER